MPRRSVLFSPGDRPEMLRKAGTSDADVVVFDLEDAVAPSNKGHARTAIAKVLSDPDFEPACELLVRVNELPGGEDDLEVILGGTTAPDGLMLPKVERETDVSDLMAAVTAQGHDLPVFALIETATGVLSATEIADSDATAGLVFGAEDLAADLGATRTDEGSELLCARQHVVLAARAGGVDAIDTVFTSLEDSSGLQKESMKAAQLGYDGKLAIHPRQITPIHEGFMPDAERLEWARKILEASESEDGVFTVEGKMIDAPLIAQAERLLERAGESNVSD